MENLGRIGFSEEQADLLEVAENFCRARSPIETVRALIEDETGHDRAIWQEMAELGWLAIAIPDEYGGIGLGLGEVVPVVEQMGRQLLTGPFVSTTLAAQAIAAGGTPAQKTHWLAKLASGTPAALALMEADGNWELDAISAKATGDDTLALSGRKILVENAGVAELIIVSLIHDGAPALALIEAGDLPDGALRRETVIDETRRSFELTLDGIEIPASRLMPPETAPATLAHIELAANLLASAEMTGATQACIDDTLDYLNTRKQFGKLIGSYQALKHPIVDAYVGYEQARSHLYSAAHSFNEQGTGEVATRMARAAVDTALSFAADRAIQFHGAFGFTYDCNAQLYRRCAIWHAARHGDASWHKRKLAELLL
jgi:acyl-CoA dehydrogenase